MVFFATAILLSVAVIIIIFLISALPLYFSVKFLGGHTTLLKTALVALLTGIIVSAIEWKFKLFGGIIAFFVMIWIYHEVFRLKWTKAFLAWILQFVFLAIFYALAIVLSAMLGISLLSLI